MNKHRNLAIIFLCATSMLTLILDSKTAMAGALDGITLCIQAVIPSLLPMMVLSSILTDYLRAYPPAFLQPVCKFLGIPIGSEGILIAGILGGYPVGATCVSAQYRSGTLKKRDAEYLLQFCSNAGPSFIFGICAALFSSQAELWMLWLIHILSAMMTAVTYRYQSTNVPKPKWGIVRSLSQTVKNSIFNMAIICGWVILFRIVILFLQQWFFNLLPTPVCVMLSGILELTNGCFMLPKINDENIRFILCSIFLNFGGICVLLQTKAVLGTLPASSYIRGKLTQAAYGIFLSYPISTILFSNAKAITKIFLIMLSITAELLLLFYAKKVIAFLKNIRYNTGELCRKR